MIRTLVLVAIVGFVLCVGAIGVAFAIAGGPFAIHDWASRDFESWSDHHGRHWRNRAMRGEVEIPDAGDGQAGAYATRDYPWSGGERLEVEVPADIVYTQGKVGKLSIGGPASTVSRVRVQDGRITFDRDYRDYFTDGARLKIELTAPGVRRFDLSGSQNLVVEAYDQDRLELDISGDAHVSAKGRAKTVSLDIAGSGDADLAAIEVEDAKIDISGSGHAKIGPKGVARVDVSGNGDVDLTTKPKSLQTDISGSGHVSQPGMPD